MAGSELFNLGQFNEPKKRKIGRWYARTGGTSGMWHVVLPLHPTPCTLHPHGR